MTTPDQATIDAASILAKATAAALATAAVETARELARLNAETTKAMADAVGNSTIELALLKQSVNMLTNTVKHYTDDHEARLRILETSDKQWALISVVASFALTLAVKLLWV